MNAPPLPEVKTALPSREKPELLRRPIRKNATRLRFENLAMQIALIAAFLGLWEYAADRWVPALFVSRPSMIGATMWAWLLDGTKPTRAGWILKSRMLPEIYWRCMLKGREWLASPHTIERRSQARSA